MATQQKFDKLNDYTLVVSLHEKRREDGSLYKPSMTIEHTLTRTFNFLAGQVTTLTQDRIYQSIDDKAGGSAAVAVTNHIQNFSDIQSSKEIELMHGNLIKLGGKPPALGDVLKTIDKKGVTISPSTM